MCPTILCAAAALFIESQAAVQAPAQIFACVNNSSGTIYIIVTPQCANSPNRRG